MPPPHEVPGATLPESVQTGAPLEHAMTAEWHGFDEAHAAPATHGTQAPLASHTPPAQAVPTGALPVSLHEGAPVLQSIDATRHAVAEVQLAPALQPPQWPAASQNIPEPHGVPAEVVPVSLHTGVPLVHSIVAV